MVNPYSDIMISSCELGGWIAGNIKSWKAQSWFVFTKTYLSEGDNVVLFKIYQLVQEHSAGSMPRPVGEGYNYKEHFTLIRESATQTVRCECLYIRWG